MFWQLTLRQSTPRNATQRAECLGRAGMIAAAF
jgi:hypothetical protein